MLRLVFSVVLTLSYISVSQAGYTLQSYYPGGTLTQGVGFIDFVDNAPVEANPKFDEGDIVYFYQDFTNVTGDGTSKPGAVFGITAFKAKVGGYTDTSGFTNSARFELEALGGTAFSDLLSSTLGIDISGVTVSSTSAFALVSSATDVALNSDGSTSFTSFEADLIAGFDGVDDFAQTTVNGNSNFLYSFYDPAVNTVPVPAFDFKIGLSVESVDDVSNFNPLSATTFTGSSASVDLTTFATKISTSAQSYSGFDGSMENGSLLTASTIPEPSSLAVFGLLGLAGAMGYRRRNN